MGHFSLFRDRHSAGIELAQAVQTEISNLALTDLSARFLVYALPRGGLPIAEPLASALNCPLDIIVAKKITLPENPELAIGAVTADGHLIRSWREVLLHQSPHSWEQARDEAQNKAQSQLAYFASSRPSVEAKGAIALLVDDGIATGMTMAVAARALRAKAPAQIWICAPVAPKQIIKMLESWSDRVVVLLTPEIFYSVSRFYATFPQVEMEEALACLERQHQRMEG